MESGKLRAYVQEAMQHYSDIDVLDDRVKDHKAQLKSIKETIAKETGAKKEEVKVFLDAKYADKLGDDKKNTKAVIGQGEAVQHLVEMLNGYHQTEKD